MSVPVEQILSDTLRLCDRQLSHTVLGHQNNWNILRVPTSISNAVGTPYPHDVHENRRRNAPNRTVRIPIFWITATRTGFLSTFIRTTLPAPRAPRARSAPSLIVEVLSPPSHPLEHPPATRVSTHLQSRFQLVTKRAVAVRRIGVRGLASHAGVILHGDNIVAMREWFMA
jgi:hypothetical protein